MLSGYLHPAYVESLAEFGTPRDLVRCKGWVLEREVPGGPARDAMGSYPLFCCENWSQLPADLEQLRDELVSLAVVTDPFGDYDVDLLRRCFPDVVIPFKEHHVVDLGRTPREIGGRRHRKHAHHALKSVQVRVCEHPAGFVDAWMGLYGALIARHHISGIRAFSRAAFARQLSVPGVVVLVAEEQGTAVGAQIYYRQGDVVHCHLGACNERGYAAMATYALDAFSIEYFAGQARWLDLGGGAGIASDGTDGLSAYKRGWATDTRTTYFCGRVLDPVRYAEINRVSGAPAAGYFPAYRRGEFG